MPRATLIRTVRFIASHRYWRDEWTDEENRGAFGEQTEPHEHEFTVEVEVVGPIDPLTGFVVDLPLLDRLLADLVAPLKGTLLNRTLQECVAGGLPSTENLSRWFFERVDSGLPEGVGLQAVSVAESDDLRAEYRP